MPIKYRQISLKDTFSDCQDMFMDDTPSFFQLLDEHFESLAEVREKVSH